MLLVTNSLGNKRYEEELTVYFVKEPTKTEESALGCHLGGSLSNTNATTICNK